MYVSEQFIETHAHVCCFSHESFQISAEMSLVVELAKGIHNMKTEMYAREKEEESETKGNKSKGAIVTN